jgi:hypothetical protein
LVDVLKVLSGLDISKGRQTTKNEDGGHFIPFDQDNRVLYIDLKVLSNEKIKIYIAIDKSTKTMSWQYIFWAMAIYIFIKTCCWCLFHV